MPENAAEKYHMNIQKDLLLCVLRNSAVSSEIPPQNVIISIFMPNAGPGTRKQNRKRASVEIFLSAFSLLLLGRQLLITVFGVFHLLVGREIRLFSSQQVLWPKGKDDVSCRVYGTRNLPLNI